MASLVVDEEPNFKVGDRVIYNNEAYTIIARVRERLYRIENPRSTVEVGEGNLQRVNPNFPDHEFDIGDKVIYLDGDMYAVLERLIGATDWYYTIENAMRRKTVQESDLQRVDIESNYHQDFNPLIRTIDAKSEVNTVAVNGGRIVCSVEKKIQEWKMDGTLRKTISDDTVAGVALEGNTIVSGSHEGVVKVWNYNSGDLMMTLKGHSNSVFNVAILNRWIVSGSFDKTVKVWNRNSGDLIKTFNGHTAPVTAVAISNNLSIGGYDYGVVIVSGSHDKTVKIWSLTNNTIVKTLEGHSGGVVSVAINNTFIVSGSTDKTIKIWHVDGLWIKSFGNRSIVISVAILSNDRIVSGSDDGVVKVWDVAEGRVIKTLNGHSAPVYSVAVWKRKNMVISGSFDKTIKIWDVSDVVRVADDESKGEERNNNKKKYTIGIENALTFYRFIDFKQWVQDSNKKLGESGFKVGKSDGGSVSLTFERAFSGLPDFEDIVIDLSFQIIEEYEARSTDFVIMDKAREEYRKRVVDRIVDRSKVILSSQIVAVYFIDKARRMAQIKLVDIFDEDFDPDDDDHEPVITREQFRARKKKYGNEYGDNVLNEVDREKRDIEEHLKRLKRQLEPITKEKIRLNKAHKAKVAAEKKLIARKERLTAWQKKIKKLTLDDYQKLLRQTYLTQMEKCKNDMDMINFRKWKASDFTTTAFFRFIRKDGVEETFCLTDSPPDYEFDPNDKPTSKDKMIFDMLYANWVNEDGSPYSLESRSGRGGRPGNERYVKLILGGAGNRLVRFDTLLKQVIKIKKGDGSVFYTEDDQAEARMWGNTLNMSRNSEIGFDLPQGWTFPVAVYLKYDKRIAMGNIVDSRARSATHGQIVEEVYRVTQIANFNHYDDINVVNECEGDCATTTVSKKRKTRLLKF